MHRAHSAKDLRSKDFCVYYTIKQGRLQVFKIKKLSVKVIAGSFGTPNEEFAPSCKISDTETTEQCFEPDSASLTLAEQVLLCK